MSPCAACTVLSGQLATVEPHPDLDLQFTRTWHDGQPGGRTGSVGHFRCMACETLVIRDIDPSDRGAIWDISLARYRAGD